ncbi:FtsB family cell division protein [Bosea sp. (in: a-proteobacteria)]|uniref:FtsB family cell division protein n=1 Tax=Bosea sp. (in: a-proteobacteria) TaxID=1871050 RepID=UPI002FC6BCF6
MVIRRGVRSILITLALYLVSSGVVGYFLFHAHHGARGLETLGGLREKLGELETEIAELSGERQGWEKRLSLMRDQAVDRDLLEERARASLGRVHRNDVVVMGR